MSAVQQHQPASQARQATPSCARKKIDWFPANWSGERFLLRPVFQDFLKMVLRDYKNRDACYRLIVFLIRYHAGPKSYERGMKTGFLIAREGLAKNGQLALSEGEIRGAIKNLIAAGLVVRLPIADDEELPWRRAKHSFIFGRELAEKLLVELRKAKSRRVRIPSPSAFFGFRSEASVASGYHGPKGPARSANPVRQAVNRPVVEVGAALPVKFSKPGPNERSIERGVGTLPDYNSDQAVMSRVMANLTEIGRTYGAIYAAVIEHMTEADQQDAIVAERAKAGSGCVLLLQRYGMRGR